MKGIIAILLLSFFSIAFSMPGLTQQQKHQIVDEINMERRNVLPYSANMREIRWSQCLQKLAGDFLLQCNPAGSSNIMRNAQAIGASCESTQIGETIFNATRFANYNPIAVWAEQGQYYDNNQCDEYDCSDYLQLIDSGSFAVGCEIIAESMKCGRPGMVAVCYYALDGTTSQAGMPCSKCGGEWKQCNNGLCSQGKGVTPGNGHGGNSHSHQSTGNHDSHNLPKLHGNNGNNNLPNSHGNNGNHGNHDLPRPHGNHGAHDLPTPHGNHGTPTPHDHQHRFHHTE